MTLDPSRIQGIIFDLDNTLYHFTDAFYRDCTMAAAEAAQELGISLSFEDTLKLAERSEQEYGYSMHGYVVDHGIAYADLHFPYHEKIDETVVGKIDGVRSALKMLNIPCSILTNASRDWADRVLRYVDLADMFDSDKIFAMEDANFEPKASSERGFRLAADSLNAPLENILMVDDLDRNLSIPHSLGMQTAYMHYGDQAEPKPEYITGQYYNILDLIKDMT